MLKGTFFTILWLIFGLILLGLYLYSSVTFFKSLPRHVYTYGYILTVMFVVGAHFRQGQAYILLVGIALFSTLARGISLMYVLRTAIEMISLFLENSRRTSMAFRCMDAVVKRTLKDYIKHENLKRLRKIKGVLRFMQ